MLNENETTLENIIHLFNHQHFTFPNHITSHTINIIEKNMSTLNLCESMAPQTFQPRDKVGIGARIMRQLRRNSSSEPAKPPSNNLKKKNMNSKAIEKLYLNKSLGRLKHTQLETIFELEEETDANENAIDESKVFGKRKIKRSLSYTDDRKPSKTLKQKRKRRIQKMFGVHKKLKPISMKKFLERLQSNDVVDVSAPQSTVGA
ncbi:protein tantalus [Contarinia nasturtii]|uniref:protein tantalus n=1 Tax=Contarinia nasturtii TaxID=265458 RepID=UPI0012D37C4B|nr:protein tantalus [Contarinia nasturtii]